VGDPALKTQVTEEIKAAMKAGDKLRLGALRMLLAAIRNAEVEGPKPRELTDDDVRAIAAKEVKKRGESIEAFDAAGRTELADRERAEREVLAAYAPEPLADDELRRLIDEAVASSGASSPADLGKVMGPVMAAARGRVDGGLVQRLVRERLGGGEG
jgi:uncharacterized protein YqeY